MRLVFLCGLLAAALALSLACSGRDGIAEPQYVERDGVGTEFPAAEFSDGSPEGARPIPDGDAAYDEGDGPVPEGEVEGDVSTLGENFVPADVVNSPPPEGYSEVPETEWAEPVPAGDGMVFSAELVDGSEWHLEDMRGSPVALVFWSHW